ncbi:two-component sensor histidine kinase [Leptospira biflexa]|uniref:sensor histidine kinase n=1 Tax=Leptospira biflexa TaxID=172 RepID=UPI0010913C24|nr:ATP-binding protein [Leptospira biflexa]TGM48324.1 two-component sensor histidine kinase [Leptospira biflexa]TGM49210.1 two-component sensor histidine kinase [Leptospira biflexa]
MVTSSYLLSQFANQMKSKGLLILISIRMVIVWIGVVASFLNFGKPPFFIAVSFTIYFLSTSILGKQFIQKSHTSKISNPIIMFFLCIDYLVLLLGFYLAIMAHPIGMKSLPIQNSIFFTLFFLFQLYISFFLHRRFSAVMGVVVILGYLGGIYIAKLNGAEIDFGYQLNPQGPNRVVFVLEFLKLILLAAKTICIVKLVSFLLDILDNNNQKLSDELNQRETSLIQNDRLVTLGSLASNVAHEIKNPLAGIKSMVSYLLSEEKNFLSNKDPLWYEKEKSILWKHRTRKEKREEMDIILQLFPFLERRDLFYFADRCIELGINYKSFEDIPSHDTKSWESIFLWLKYKTMENASILITNAIDRTEKVISTFQQFSKPFSTKEKEKVRISDGIRDILVLYHQYWDENRILITDIDDHLETYVNEAAIKLVWSHLIFNAIQATDPKTGEIKVEVKLNPSNQIEIRVIDNGVGIPIDLQKNIFQPFYTTKQKGEGIGLGLYISNSILSEENGSITFFSVPGKTEFIVTLPMMESNTQKEIQNENKSI